MPSFLSCGARVAEHMRVAAGLMVQAIPAGSFGGAH